MVALVPAFFFPPVGSVADHVVRDHRSSLAFGTIPRMAYDRADWHYGGDYPPGLPPENGGTHIGMFLAWAIHRGLEGDLHRQESSGALGAVRERRLTGREFLFSECDEKLWEEDLSDEGNAFAKAYYERTGAGGYLADYEAALGTGLPSLYHVEDTWENFDRIARIIDRRYAAWKQGTSRRPWWRFWG